MRSSLKREAHVLPRAPEDGLEIMAIGDIHGRADLFDALLDAASREPKRAARRALVLLGDLVDRGPENLMTLKLAREAPRRVGADAFIALMGNHEAMMRLALDEQVPFDTALDAFGAWVRNGGREVLKEFAPPESNTPRRPEEWLQQARANLPRDVLDWLRSLRPHWRSGGLLFVHAGVNPRLELETFLAQPWDVPLRRLDEDRHWAWVREPFLRHRPGDKGYSGYFVVHGHTPRDAGIAPRHADQIVRFRANLDGGSGFTGESKLGIFRGPRVEVLTTSGPTNSEL